MATIKTIYDSDGNTINTLYDTQSISITGISNVVEDTTPQLGGNLDLNSNNITGTGNISHTGTLAVTGNITVSGTVDGRDLATDGTKLDGIEASATADQTDSEIETAYNNQVAQVSSGERTAGTEVNVRRFSPADIATMAGIHGETYEYIITTTTDTTSLTAADWNDVTLNTEIKKDSSFTHSANSAEITLSAGIHLCFMQFRVTAAGRVDCHVNASIDTGGGYAIHRQSKLPIIFAASPVYSIAGNTFFVPYNASSGDKIKFQMYPESGSWTLGKCELVIVKIT